MRLVKGLRVWLRCSLKPSIWKRSSDRYLPEMAKQIPNLFFSQLGHDGGHVSIIFELDPPSAVVVALL